MKIKPNGISNNVPHRKEMLLAHYLHSNNTFPIKFGSLDAQLEFWLNPNNHSILQLIQNPNSIPKWKYYNEFCVKVVAEQWEKAENYIKKIANDENFNVKRFIEWNEVFEILSVPKRKKSSSKEEEVKSQQSMEN